MKEATQKKVRSVFDRLGLGREWFLIVIGALIGVITGAAAVGFSIGLHWVEALSNDTQEKWTLWLLPLIPMIGALVTGVVVHLLASDARGHGVPQVMRAILKRGGVIHLRVGIAKIISSIATVGSGGSAGSEGPIVHIGSTAGSAVGQKMGMDRDDMNTLVGCGAAAGIASIFHAPIAGVFFVLEILLRDFSLKTFAPIVIAAVLSSATTQTLLDDTTAEGKPAAAEAIFQVDEGLADYTFAAAELPSFVVLGLICGVLAVGFAKLLHKSESLFAQIKVHPIIKPVIGAAMLGALGILFMLLAPDPAKEGPTPAFFGNGYDTIRNLLDPDWYREIATDPTALLAIALALVVLKMVATCMTLGSGGSGGVFAPSLFLGATAGAAFGVALESLNLMPEGNTPAGYALVGMAAVVAAGTHAPLTAILMLFELTRNPYVLLPIMLAAIVSTVVAQIIDKDSIYTAPLRRAGIVISRAKDQTLLRRLPVTDVPLTPLPPEPVYPSDPLSKLVTLHAYHSVPDFVVVDQNGRYMGMVTGADMRAALIDREAIPLLLVAELMRADLPVIRRDEKLDTVMEKFAHADISSLALVDDGWAGGGPAGLITRAKVMQCYNDALEAAE